MTALHHVPAVTNWAFTVLAGRKATQSNVCDLQRKQRVIPAYTPVVVRGIALLVRRRSRSLLPTGVKGLPFLAGPARKVRVCGAVQLFRARMSRKARLCGVMQLRGLPSDASGVRRRSVTWPYAPLRVERSRCVSTLLHTPVLFSTSGRENFTSLHTPVLFSRIPDQRGLSPLVRLGAIP